VAEIKGMVDPYCRHRIVEEPSDPFLFAQEEYGRND